MASVVTQCVQMINAAHLLIHSDINVIQMLFHFVLNSLQVGESPRRNTNVGFCPLTGLNHEGMGVAA